MMALKEEEERRMEEADEIFYTREDNQVNIFASSSSSESSSLDDAVVPKSKRVKQTRRVGRKRTDIVRGRGRGRGRGKGRGYNDLSALDAESKQTSSNESSVDVDDIKSRDGDPLWREYGQEIGGIESDEWDTEATWQRGSGVELLSEDESAVNVSDPDQSLLFRESPLWRVAAESEKLLDANEVPHIDYGPNEIMSFSKSGRPRKRNKRLYQDEYEVFSPVSGFSDSAVPLKKATPKTLYNVVIETSCGNSASLQSVQKIAPTKLKPVAPLKEKSIQPASQLVASQHNVLVPYSLISAVTPACSPTLSHASRTSTAMSSFQQRIVTQHSSIAHQSLQRLSTAQNTKTLLPVISLSAKTKPQTDKHRDNLFELDFTLESTPESLGTLVAQGGGDNLITLDLEPVNLSQENFFEPSNEEERNVFESFASLLH